jgi:Na+-transporting methylmalonyl-CoA/oxaloacetate decarboxylase gamma subunit
MPAVRSSQSPCELRLVHCICIIACENSGKVGQSHNRSVLSCNRLDADVCPTAGLYPLPGRHLYQRGLLPRLASTKAGRCCVVKDDAACCSRLPCYPRLAWNTSQRDGPSAGYFSIMPVVSSLLVFFVSCSSSVLRYIAGEASGKPDKARQVVAKCCSTRTTMIARVAVHYQHHKLNVSTSSSAWTSWKTGGSASVKTTNH